MKINLYYPFRKSFGLLVGTLLLVVQTLLAQNDCVPLGWATQNGGTTGGGSASPVVVSTLADFQAQAASAGAKVIVVQGTLGAGVSTRVVVASNKTIFGSPGAVLNGGIDIKNAKNVIVRNLTIKGPGAVDVDGVDCISIDNSTNVWIDHCVLMDGQDGNLDIVNGSNFVTVSWTKFQYTSKSQNHMFCNLFGNSDSKTTDRGKLKITLLNNWWSEGVLERMPRVRFGQIHIVNNLFSSAGNSYCVRAGIEANLLVEGNVFRGVKNPIDLYENNFTAVTVRNNLFLSTTGGTAGKGTSFAPPYTLAVRPAAEVENLVRASSGATLTGLSSCGGTTVNAPPSVTLTSPVQNATASAPASFVLTASAIDTDGSVTQVKFYSGTNLLATDVLSPYSFTWSNVPAGTYTFTAVATDNQGGVTTSSPIQVTVSALVNTAPVVSITAPAGGASYSAPATISLSANASDTDGNIAQVQFYNGSTLLGADATAPYSFTWSSVGAGTYTLTARATDNLGAVAISSSISVSVVANTPVGDIQGSACGIRNTSGVYELTSAQRTNATSYSWWYTGSSQSIQPIAGSPYQATLNYGSSFSSGSVCVGVNYSVSPWYKQFCKTLTVCGTRMEGDAMETSAEEMSVQISPNPSTTGFNLIFKEEVLKLKVYDPSGRLVYDHEGGGLGNNLILGESFAEGIYQVIIFYANGRMEFRKLSKI